ncbi:MAG: hypothetical protein ACFFD3_17315, partial [Candidatus Thorarchaeota archaeon]
MKRGCIAVLALFLFFLLPIGTGSDFHSEITQITSDEIELSNSGILSDIPARYIGKGVALDVTATGIFTSNSSQWTQLSSTYAEDYSSGTTFSVTNASTVTWTAYAFISPPADVQSVSFSVGYHYEDWVAVSVTNPLGQVKSKFTDWTVTGGLLHVSEASVDSFGFWKITFTSENFLHDLKIGRTGSSLSITDIFNITDEMEIEGSTPWVTNAATRFTLTEPSGVEWSSSTNTTTGSSTFLLPSFKYSKAITVDSSLVGPSDVVNLPVLINITDSDLHTDVQSDGDDIVFVSGSSILAHEIEVFNQNYNSTHAYLRTWVRANLSSTVNTIITMYYGNSYVDSMQDPTEVWDNEYAAVWHLNEQVTDEQTTGTHVDSTGTYDASQNGNDDVVTPWGRGQLFLTDDRIVVASSQNLNPPGDVTISGWFKLNTAFGPTSPTSQMILSKYLSGDNDMHVALVGTDYTGASARLGAMVFKLENDDFVSRYYIYTARTTWAANTWYHFACTIDRDTPTNHKIYINGVDNTFLRSGSGAFNNVSYVGEWGFGGGFVDGQFGVRNPAFFDGTLDEIRVADTLPSASYLLTQYYSQNSPKTFYSVSAEVVRPITNPQWVKQLDSSAKAGIWTLTAFYNDSGSTVNRRVGMYQRCFVVRHDSSLTLDAPGDAIGDLLAAKIAGDLLYVEVNLTDDVDSSFVSGATLTMNWTIGGSPVLVLLEDYGDGRYGKAVNTTDLPTFGRWRINIQSAHSYYNPASAYFDLDLSHRTILSYSTPPSAPYGDDFTVNIMLRDEITLSPISGATITTNGTFVGLPTDNGDGTYSITLDSVGLSVGDYIYEITATPSNSYLLDASVAITFTLRDIHTAAYGDGGNSLTTPYAFDTSMTITYNDVDHGLSGIAGATASQIQSPSGIVASVVEVSGGEYTVNFDVGTKAPGVYLINITLSKTDYENARLTIALTIRAHKTFINIAYDSLVPYGNSSDFTVTWYDADNGNSVISATYLNQITVGATPFGAFSFILDTSSWAVGNYQRNVTLYSSSALYQHASMLVTITIRPLSIYLHHEPSDLIFPSGDDFVIVLLVNVSELGNQYDGDPILGLLQSEFSVSGYSISISALGNGRYQLTISGAGFSTGEHQITVVVDPTGPNYYSDTLLITFRYRPAISFLSSPSYPLVITPVETNVAISLNYTDVDRSIGITGATITSSGITINYVEVGNGIYTVTLIVTGLSKGNYQFNLTATEAVSETKTLTFTLTIRIAYTYAVPSVGALDIPIGNDPIFYVNYTDIDHLVPVSNSTGAVSVLSTWGSFLVQWLDGEGRYRITF